MRDYEFLGIVSHTTYLNDLQHTRHEFLKKAGMNSTGDKLFVGVNVERI